MNTGQVQRGDSIIFLQPYYTYATFANEITCCNLNTPSQKQIKVEAQWDSIQYNTLNQFFRSSFLRYGNRQEYYNKRPFKFKVLLGGPSETISDSISYLISLFTWNIRAGKLNDAYSYLPDTILSLSNKHPIAIITNNFYFYDIQFQADHASGSTGLQLIPECFLVILQNGKVQYFRGYSKGIAYHKILKDPSIINNFTIKLLDKLY